MRSEKAIMTQDGSFLSNALAIGLVTASSGQSELTKPVRCTDNPTAVAPTLDVQLKILSLRWTCSSA